MIRMTPQDLIENPKCLCVINTSGGKDSQAMSLYFQNMWKTKGYDPNRLVFIHSTLGIAEWPGIIEAIKSQITGNHDLHIVSAQKSLLEMTIRSGKWPTAQFRQCTSDLKRGPIQSKVKALLKKGKYEYVLDCMGMRAEESDKRAQLSDFSRKAKLCTVRFKREWYQFLPIHSWKIEDVFFYIRQYNQNPFWTYSAGMSRCSCKLCIMATDADLYTAMNLDFENFMTYCVVERYLDNTFRSPKKKVKNGQVISITKRFLPEVIEYYASKYDKKLPVRWTQINANLQNDDWVLNEMIRLFPKGVPETKSKNEKVN